MVKHWFRFHRPWAALFCRMSNEDAGIAIKAICEHWISGTVQDVGGIPGALYYVAMEDMKTDAEHDAEVSRKKAENGARGGRQKEANRRMQEILLANATNKNQNKESYPDKNQNNIQNHNHNDYDRYCGELEGSETAPEAGRAESDVYRSAVSNTIWRYYRRDATTDETEIIASQAQAYGFSPNMISLAITRAAEHSARNVVHYVGKILADWKAAHVTTPEEAAEQTAMVYAGMSSDGDPAESIRMRLAQEAARQEREAKHEKGAG